MRKISVFRLFFLGSFWGLAIIGHAQNFIVNPDFAVGGSDTTLTGTSVVAPSAASNWGIYIGATGTTLSGLATSGTNLPTGVPGGVTTGIKVTASAAGGGLVQQWAADNTGPNSAAMSVYVYVVQGSVGIGCGNGGSTTLSGASTTTGKWELISTTNNNSPVNEATIYATSANTIFFTTHAVVSSVPEPASFLALGLGATVLVRRRKK